MKKSNTRQIAPKPTKNGFLPSKINPNRKAKSKESMGEWKHINWRKLERCVFKLQKRIYKASLRGDVKTVRRLQKMMMLRLESRVLFGAISTLIGMPTSPGNPFSLSSCKRVINPAYAVSK